MTVYVRKDKADKEWEATTIEWQEVDSSDVHKIFENKLEGVTIEKREFNADGEPLLIYVDKKERENELGVENEEDEPLYYVHKAFTYDANAAILKIDFLDRDGNITTWYDFVHTYDEDSNPLNTIVKDANGDVMGSTDYIYLPVEMP